MNRTGGTSRRPRLRKNASRARAGNHRFFIVDGHPIVRCGLAALLEERAGLRCCGESGEGPAARRLIESARPDLVVTEVSLRLGDGFDLLRHLKTIEQPPRVLVLSAHEDSLFAERVLRAGAHGYVCKKEPVRTLLQSLRTVLSGGIHVSPSVSSRILGRLASGNGLNGQSPLEKLTDRELQVLLLLGQGLRTREIAERLILSVKTIDTYREHLKKKLNLSSHNDLVRFAITWVLSSGKPIAASGAG